MAQILIVLSNTELAGAIARAVRSDSIRTTVASSMCDPRASQELPRAELIVTDLPAAAIAEFRNGMQRRQTGGAAVLFVLPTIARELPRPESSPQVEYVRAGRSDLAEHIAARCRELLARPQEMPVGEPTAAGPARQPGPATQPIGGSNRPQVAGPRRDVAVDCHRASPACRESDGRVVGGRHRVRDGLTPSRSGRRVLRAQRQHERLVSEIAHDVRSPLMAIREYAQMLGRETAGPLGPEQRRYVDVIDRRAREIARMVDNLLDGVRLQAGHLHPHRAPIALGAVAADLQEALGPSFRQNQVELRRALPDDLPPVFGDEDMVGRILSNLLTNALKFTKPGGVVETAAERLSMSEIRVTVSDTGTGISPGDLRRIFRRFKRGARPDGDGVGLGLAIVRQFVRLHGGRVSAESVPGRGSRFHFTLPIFLPAAIMRNYLRNAAPEMAALGIACPPEVKFDAMHRYVTSTAAARDLVLPLEAARRILWIVPGRRERTIQRLESDLRSVAAGIPPFLRLEAAQIGPWIEGHPLANRIDRAQAV